MHCFLMPSAVLRVFCHKVIQTCFVFVTGTSWDLNKAGLSGDSTSSTVSHMFLPALTLFYSQWKAGE